MLLVVTKVDSSGSKKTPRTHAHSQSIEWRLHYGRNFSKKIRGRHQSSAIRMVNTVRDMITAFEAVPTSKLEDNRFLQLKLSLEEKLTTILSSWMERYYTW